MKKIFLSTIVAMFALVANATELFSGSQYVTWGMGLQITADKFADAKPGDRLVITYTGATDGLELKVMDDFSRLPGSRQWCPIDGDGSENVYLTYAAVAKLQAAGLEMIGNNFTVTKVELLDGKDNVTENTMWTGYFWMDNWTTLELAMTAFNGVNWDEVEAIRFYNEAGRTDYILKIMISWDEKGLIADQDDMTMTNEYAELNVEGVDVAAILAGNDNLMIQCNKEGGDPFNFTSIELVKKGTGVKGVKQAAAAGVVYDLVGRKVGNAPGVTISGGKAILSK